MPGLIHVSCEVLLSCTVRRRRHPARPRPLVSTGTSLHLEDNLQDVWGEVSAGVNFFNPSANTSVFAKLDVTFGDNIGGVGGKAGMRVSW
jgi:hypothetical protein